jgi:hypothetical protein
MGRSVIVGLGVGGMWGLAGRGGARVVIGGGVGEDSFCDTLGVVETVTLLTLLVDPLTLMMDFLSCFCFSSAIHGRVCFGLFTEDPKGPGETSLDGEDALSAATIVWFRLFDEVL